MASMSGGLGFGSLRDAKAFEEQILTKDERWTAAREKGWLEEVRVQLNPDDPTQGEVVSRWSSLEALNQFLEGAGGPERVFPEQEGVRISGSPKILVHVDKLS